MNVETIRKDFPILSRQVNGLPLVYLDNAATSHKPLSVINGIVDYYTQHNANVHRGAHTLGDESTDMYMAARVKVANFIGAKVPEEIIFTKNATDSLNLVAGGWARNYLQKGDGVLVLSSEHNSNLLPWQEVCLEKGAVLDFINLDDSGQILWEDLKQKITENVKVVSVAHASNVLGTIFPVKEIVALAKTFGAKVVVDGSQGIPHLEVNVQSLGCDFYAFSSHKMLGPMGVGVLWGKTELLEKTSPISFGGGMILSFSLTDPQWQPIPDRFESGTPDVAGVVGLGLALDYLNQVGMDNIRAHEIDLTKYAIEILKDIPGLHIMGPLDPQQRTGLITFTIDGIHSHDVASVLSSMGIAVRSGMHCAMNYHKNLHIPASTRASFYLYNTREEVDKLKEGVLKAITLLK